eukprot:365230-Chlamydomonas_euryale.AAC.1
MASLHMRTSLSSSTRVGASSRAVATPVSRRRRRRRCCCCCCGGGRRQPSASPDGGLSYSRHRRIAAGGASARTRLKALTRYGRGIDAQKPRKRRAPGCCTLAPPSSLLPPFSAGGIFI